MELDLLLNVTLLLLQLFLLALNQSEIIDLRLHFGFLLVRLGHLELTRDSLLLNGRRSGTSRRSLASRILVSSERVFGSILAPLLLLDLLHHRSTNLTRRRPPIALADSVVIQDAATTQAVRRLAVLVSAGLHVLPKSDHLRAELRSTLRTSFTFAGMTQQDQTLLLLQDNPFLLSF